jgi:hypothetical protein
MPSEEPHMVSVLAGKPGADNVATAPWTCPWAFAVCAAPMTVSGQVTWVDG